MSTKEEILQQLDELIAVGRQLISSYKSEGDFVIASEPEERFRAFVTGAFAAIARVAGENSEYYRTIPRDYLNRCFQTPDDDNYSFIPSVLGATEALRNAVDKGYLTSLESRLRANVHDDFLTQANELLKAGYHIAAMVIAGGVLENHLFKLVTIRGLTGSGGNSLSKYNDKLKDTVYPQTTWRRIQSISDVRNASAHGQTENVKCDDVRDALSFIPRILTDYPS